MVVNEITWVASWNPHNCGRFEFISAGADDFEDDSLLPESKSTRPVGFAAILNHRQPP